MSTTISGTTGINNVTDATTQITTIANGYDLGVGQTWQDVTASRAAGVTYTNTTGKPIMVNIISSPSASNYVTITIDGIDLGYTSFNASLGQSSNRNIVPIGATYSVIVGGASLYKWYELR